MGITRILIVGLAALILAPMPPENQTATANGETVAELQTHQLVSVAIGTFTDVSSFCERQALTCKAMGDVADIAVSGCRQAQTAVGNQTTPASKTCCSASQTRGAGIQATGASHCLGYHRPFPVYGQPVSFLVWVLAD